MIKSIRRILNALLKNQTLDDESLSTLMCEVESILNARPLTKVSDDSRDLNALIPNHLLLLKSHAVLPPGIFDKSDQYCNKRWRQIQLWRMCSGSDGCGNTYQFCKQDKNGKQ